MNHNPPSSCHSSKRRNKWTSWAETTNPTTALHSFTSSPLTLEQSHLTRPLFRKWKRKLHISPSILTATRLLLFTWRVREIEDTGIIRTTKQPESRNRPVLTSQVLLERSGTFDSVFGQRVFSGLTELKLLRLLYPNCGWMCTNNQKKKRRSYNSKCSTWCKAASSHFNIILILI